MSRLHPRHRRLLLFLSLSLTGAATAAVPLVGEAWAMFADMAARGAAIAAVHSGEDRSKKVSLKKIIKKHFRCYLHDLL